MTTNVGRHLLVDFYGCKVPIKAEKLQRRLSDAAHAAGATVLSGHCHDFVENEGATAFVMLAESHISAHTWPEREVTAIDIFMCGDAQTDVALDRLRALFAPVSEHVTIHLRGVNETSGPSHPDNTG